MKRILYCLFIVGAVVALATSANAITAGTIPNGATNEFIDGGTIWFPGPSIGGYYGAQLYLNSSGSINLTLDYFGAEAGYRNEFNFNGSEVFAHTGGTNIATNYSTPLATASVTASPGLLNFSFDFDSDTGSVVNGFNPDDSASTVGPNFFVSFNPFSSSAGGSGGGQSVWVFLDDGGAGPDDNHDDFLVKISIDGDGNITVPEPTTILLLGLGMVGLAGIRRKMKT